MSIVSSDSFFERHRFLMLFALLSTLMGTSVGMAKIATSLYAIELRAPSALLGLIAGAQTIGILFMSLPIGHLVDKIGPRRLFVTGTLLAGGTYIVLPLVPSPWFLLFCTVAISFFMPMRFVSLNAVFMAQLERVGPDKAGWYRGTHMTGMFLIGPVVTTGSIILLGFAGTYWSIALLFLLTVLICPVVLGPSTASRGGVQLNWRDITGQLQLLKTERELRTTCLVEFSGQGVNAFYTFFILIIAIQQLGLDASSATLLISIEGLSFITSLFILGGMLSRLGVRRAYALSLSLSVLSLMALGMSQSFEILMVSGGALGVALGCLQTVNLSVFARIGARLGRGRISGISSLSGPTGSLAASLTAALLGQVIGLQGVFLAFAFAFVLLLLALRTGEPLIT